MEIKAKMCLIRYSPQQVIELIKDGIVTTQEVIDSGVEHSFFTNILSDYLYRDRLVKRQLKHDALADTLVMNRRRDD